MLTFEFLPKCDACVRPCVFRDISGGELCEMLERLVRAVYGRGF
jgi:hypothetical protein